MRPEAYIAAYGLACPPMLSTETMLAAMATELRRVGKPESLIRKLTFLTKSAKIKQRPIATTRYHRGTDYEDKMFLGKRIGDYWPLEGEIAAEERDAKPEERADIWKSIAPKLAVEAGRAALAKWSGKTSDITHILVTNTSGWAEPGLASYVIHGLGLPLTTQKAELNFNGCFCGMTCLRLARDIVRSGEDNERRAVLVIGVEIASLHWSQQMEDADLLATSLFADGAAGYVVTTSGQWKFKDAGMATVPDSFDLLGLEPYAATGQAQTPGSYRMKLSPQVSSAIASYFSKGPGNPMLHKIIKKNCVGQPELAVHPGGPRILDSLKDVLAADFGFGPTALDPSFSVLHNFGNLGSTAILYVLHEVFNSTSKDEVVSMAFGPGVTFEWGAFERVSSNGISQGA